MVKSKIWFKFFEKLKSLISSKLDLNLQLTPTPIFKISRRKALKFL